MFYHYLLVKHQTFLKKDHCRLAWCIRIFKVIEIQKKTIEFVVLICTTILHLPKSVNDVLPNPP